MFDISFDQEITTWYKYDQTLTHGLDKISSVPHIEAQSVRIGIYEDGEVALTIQKIQASKYVFQNPKPLPNPQADWERLEIQQGQLTAFDANSDKVYQAAVALPNQIDLVDALDSMTTGPINGVINQVTGCSGIPQGQFTFEAFIDYLEKLGATVTIHDPGFMTMRIPVVKLGIPGTDEIVLLMDITNKLIAGYVLYDAQNILKSSVMYTYTTTAPHLIDMMQLTTMVELPSGEVAELVTEIDINNLNYAVNLN